MYFRQILFIVFIFIIGIYLLVLTYGSIESDSVEQLYKEQLIYTSQVSNYLETAFSNYDSYLAFLSRQEDIVNFNAEGKRLLKFFFGLHKEDIKGMILVDSMGIVYYTGRNNLNLLGKNLSFRENIKKVITRHTPSLSSLIYTFDKFNSVTLYYPMFKKDIFVGAIGILIPFDELTKKALKNIKIKKTGYTWIIDQNGNILYHPNLKYCNTNSFEIFKNYSPALSMLKNAVKGYAGSAEFQSQFCRKGASELVYNVYYPIPAEDNTWSVIITTPKKEILLMTKGVLIKLIGIFAFLTFGSIIYLYYIIKAHSILKEQAIRKKAEGELINSEKRFQKLVEVSPDAIILSDIHGKILTCNQMAAKLAGYEGPDDLVGLNSIQFIAPEDKMRAVENLIKTVNEGITREFQYMVLRKDGSAYPAEISTSVITDKDDNPIGLAGILRDITERKRIEQMLLEAKEAAEKSDRFKSEFLAQMSHEIRSPINVILSFSNLLQDEIYDLVPEDLKGSFSIMRKAGKRIIRTVDLILNMSELQTGLFEPSLRKIKLKAEILDQVYMEFRQFAREKGIELLFLNETGFNDVTVIGDEYTLGQIFNNLVNNAIKFTEKGKVEIIILINAKNKIVVQISDTGIGISEEYLQNLFKPFTQEEQGYTRRYEGNGLGLALVKKYCEINNASIQVESKKEMGTIFSVIFSGDNN